MLVVNSIESVWCQVYGNQDGARYNTWARGLGAADPAVQKLERQYGEMFMWLAGAQVDFDYGDEAMMARMARIERDAQGKSRAVGRSGGVSRGGRWRGPHPARDDAETPA